MEVVMEKAIRILVATGPRLLRELILHTLADQPDIDIVDEVANEADVPERVEKTNPDFVIIAQNTLGERPGVCATLLRQRPETQIIVVAPHHDYSVYYWASLEIHSREVEASEEALLGILRSKDLPPLVV
jgi:DNA-binding NarL/FixJ family response regulator